VRLGGLLLAIILTVMGFVPGPVRAELPLRGQAVNRVVLDAPGLDPIEGLSYVEIRAGDRFSVEAVRRSIKLLYLLGLYGQVRVTATQEADGLALRFACTPKTSVVAVDILGAEAVGLETLKRMCRLRRGEEYDHWKMEASAADMQALYRKRGYRKTRVVPETSPAGDHALRVRYYIQEGSPTRVGRVDFQGAGDLPLRQLERVLGLAPGDVFDVEILDSGGKRLLAYLRAEGYLEAKVEVPKLDLESDAAVVRLSIKLDTGRQVFVEFEGNQVLKSLELRKVLKLKNGVRLSQFGMQDLAERIESRYRKSGFARVLVEGSLSHMRQPGARWVTFSIQEGPRVTVRSVRFEGNREFDNATLRDYLDNAMLDAVPLSLLGQPIDRGDVDVFSGGHPLRGKVRRVNRPQGFLFDLVPETMYLPGPYQKALDDISDLYRSRGYLDVHIESPLLSYGASGANLYITIPVEEGVQTRVESISFGGNQAVSAGELLAVAEGAGRYVKPGEALDQFGVEMLRKELTRFYSSKGYVYCRVELDLIFSEDRSLAGVVFNLSEGPQVRVRRVLVRGNLLTSNRIFDSLVSLRPKAMFSPQKASESQQALLDLGIFAGVDIKLVDSDLAEAEKNVVVTVRERLPHVLGFGPGLSSGEGLRVALEYTRRNLFGYGLEFVSKAKVNYQVFYPLLQSSLRDRYEHMGFLEGLEGWLVAGVHWPRLWWLERKMAGRIDIWAMQDHAISYDLTKVSLVPGFDMKLTDELALDVEAEVEFNSLTCPFAEEEMLCEEGSGMQCGVARRQQASPCGGAITEQRWLRYDEGALWLGSLRPELSWDRRDNPFNPHRGTLVFLRSELTTNLAGDREVLFSKFDVLISGYIPLGRTTTLALSLRSGFIFHLTDDSRTPSHKLFFLGGRNSVRSYNEEALIPSDLDPPCILRTGTSGERYCVSPGGNAYFTIKVELRFPMIPGVLDGAVFSDLGNLWMEPNNFNPIDLRPAAGLGLRLVTPIGPMAFDLGINLDPDERRAEDRWNLHFNIGVF